MESDCVFCKIINKEIKSDIVAETEHVLVIKDINPKATIHYLIMPKKHIKDVGSLEQNECCLASKMILMAKKLSLENEKCKDFRLMANNGYGAGQRVFHLHFHFLAGSALPEF